MSGAEARQGRNRDRESSGVKREYGGDRNHGENRGEKRERSPSGPMNHHDHRRSKDSRRMDLAEDGDLNTKKKIASRCRLFVGNLTSEVKEGDLKEMFEKYGEITEFFMSSKGFSFVRMDTRAHAEMAKENLDGYTLKGRSIRVRYAVHGASLKVRELNPFVSNELLAEAFQIFGDVERAVHILDEKSQPTGEGIVEFERKPGAVDALRRINEGVFLLTSNPKPIFVEPLDPRDDEDGLGERMVQKNLLFSKERIQPPRFALPGSFEFEYGNRWKELYRLERLRREQLDHELKESREKLENEMELAYQEYQTAQLREDLKRRQEELERLEATRRERLEQFRQREEERTRSRQQMPPPGFIPPNYGQSEDQNDGDFMKEQILHHHMAMEQMHRPEFPRPPGTQPHRPNEQLVHGVQRLMQIMQGGDPATRRLGMGRPGQPPSGVSPQDVQQQRNLAMRPNLLTNPFGSDGKDRRGPGAWNQEQDRGRNYYH